MSSQYLTPAELSAVCGVSETSYKAMCRRLAEMGWPHSPRPGRCPLVLRSVHDKILTGQRRTAAA